MGYDKIAGRCIYLALKYNRLKLMRSRLFDNGNPNGDIIPTLSELQMAKHQMEFHLRRFKREMYENY